VNGQIFQCQTSEDTYLFPNVRDVKFNATTVSSGSYKRLNTEKEVRFYKIPAYSISGRNCSGNVTSIRHCYWINKKKLNNNLPIFKVVLGSYMSLFRVTRLITINSTPTDSKCIATSRGRRVCCDNFETNNRFLFQVPEQQHVFGIDMSGGYQVSITNSYTMSYYERKNNVEVSKSYSLGASRSEPVVLIQFQIGKSLYLISPGFHKCACVRF